MRDGVGVYTGRGCERVGEQNTPNAQSADWFVTPVPLEKETSERGKRTKRGSLEQLDASTNTQYLHICPRTSRWQWGEHGGIRRCCGG